MSTKKKRALSDSKLISGVDYQTFHNKTRWKFIYVSIYFLLGVRYLFIMSVFFLCIQK